MDLYWCEPGEFVSFLGNIKKDIMATNNAVNSRNILLQQVSATTNSRVTINVITPYDDTIPQNTEGVEVITVTITPISATSRLQIMFSSVINKDEAGNPSAVVALFQDTTANALAAAAMLESQSTPASRQVYLEHVMTSGTTSATTFKIRIGSSSTTLEWYVNGTHSGRLMGGVFSTVLTVNEYA